MVSNKYRLNISALPTLCGSNIHFNVTSEYYWYFNITTKSSTVQYITLCHYTPDLFSFISYSDFFYQDFYI